MLAGVLYRMLLLFSCPFGKCLNFSQGSHLCCQEGEIQNFEFRWNLNEIQNFPQGKRVKFHLFLMRKEGKKKKEEC